MNISGLVDFAENKKLEISALVLLLSAAAFIPLFHDITRNFLANPDMDLYLTHRALLITSGLPFMYYEHTAYVYLLLLSGMLYAAHRLGFVDTVDLTVLGSSSPEDFAVQYAQIIIVGRVLSVILALVAVVLVWLLARELSRNRFFAILAAFLMALSLGLGVQSVMLRTELPSMVFILASVLALLRAQKNAEWRGIVWLCCSSFFAMAAAMTKVQAILVVVFIPLIPFIVAGKAGAAPAAPPRPRELYLFMVVAAVVSLPALVWLFGKIDRSSDGIYQALIVAFVLGSIAVYGWKIANASRWILPAMFAVALGIACAQYLNLIKDHWWTTYGVMNFVEILSRYLSERGATEYSGLSSLFLILPRNAAAFINEELLTEHIIDKNYPIQLVYWSALIGLVILLRKKMYAEGAAVFLFLSMAIILPSMFLLRGYIYSYRIYVETWAIVAAAVAAAALYRASDRKAVVVVVGICVSLVVTGVQTRYRLLAPSTANSRPAHNICSSMTRVTFIRHQFTMYCLRSRTETPPRRTD